MTISGHIVLLNWIKPDTSIVPLMGLIAKRFEISSSLIESTHIGSTENWTEYLEVSGKKSIKISGSGYFRNSEAELALFSSILNNNSINLSVEFPAFTTMTGQFIASDINYNAERKGELQYDVTIHSSGEVLIS